MDSSFSARDTFPARGDLPAYPVRVATVQRSTQGRAVVYVSTEPHADRQPVCEFCGCPIGEPDERCPALDAEPVVGHPDKPGKGTYYTGSVGWCRRIGCSTGPPPGVARSTIASPPPTGPVRGSDPPDSPSRVVDRRGDRR